MIACTAETHDRLKRSTADWRDGTTPLGVQRFTDGGPDLELRNCRCGSTLARELRAEPAR